MTRPEVVERVREMVGYAASLCPDVEFSPEDAGRTEPEFLYEVLSVAIEAGADHRSTSPTPSATPCPTSSAR